MSRSEKKRYVDRLTDFALERYKLPGRFLIRRIKFGTKGEDRDRYFARRNVLEENIDSNLKDLQDRLRPLVAWMEGKNQPPLKNPLLEWIEGKEQPLFKNRFLEPKQELPPWLDIQMSKEVVKTWFKKDRIPSLLGRYNFKRKYALHTINGRFTVNSEIGLVKDPDWWKDIIFENFIQLISGLPADLFSKRMIKCKGCGRVFLHLTMRKKDFCSPECASRSIARAKREALKENPRKYAAYKKAMKEYKENWKRKKNKKRKKQTRANPTK
jgi:hypothetical protein